MIDVKPQLVSVLNEILPTYYELIVDSSVKLPCITYLEIGNSDNLVGDTLGYSDITMNIKIWSNTVSDIATYMPQVDKALRDIGYKRISSNELVMGTQICKILTYQGLGLEEFTEEI